MNISLSAFAPENLISRDGFGSPVPDQPAYLRTRAEPGAYLWDSSRLPRRCHIVLCINIFICLSVFLIFSLSILDTIIACFLPRLLRRHARTYIRGQKSQQMMCLVRKDQGMPMPDVSRGVLERKSRRLPVGEVSFFGTVTFPIKL